MGDLAYDRCAAWREMLVKRAGARGKGVLEALLKLILAKYMFLFEPGRFRFTNSLSHESKANGLVDLTWGTLTLRFLHDKGVLSIEYRSSRAREAFRHDLVERLLLGGALEGPFESAQRARFLEENIDEVHRRFESDLEQTVEQLKRLERMRMKEMWR